MKSGDYLSSRRLTASTFGVRKLNFCVRNGNRWILSAIITTMVIYQGFRPNTYIFNRSSLTSRFSFPSFRKNFSLFQSPFPKTDNYIAILSSCTSGLLSLIFLFCFLARKNYRILCKDFVDSSSSHFIEIKPSTY